MFIGFCGAWLLILAAEPDAFIGIAWLITVVACNDSIAYFAGRRFGKHAFAPAISPKKTIEGSFAGLFGGMTVGAIIGLLLMPDASMLHNFILAGFVIVAAQMGDLIKSLLKRLHNTKDWGICSPVMAVCLIVSMV